MVRIGLEYGESPSGLTLGVLRQLCECATEPPGGPRSQSRSGFRSSVSPRRCSARASSARSARWAWVKSPGDKAPVKPHVVDFKTINHIKVNKSRVRQKPSNKGTVLTVLKKGDKVKILDNNEDWWKVQADGKTGWISKDDLDVQVR